MKLLLLCLIFFTATASAGATAFERTVGPSHPGPPLAEDLMLARKIGFTLSKPYSKVRTRLRKHGWSPDSSWGLSGPHERLTYSAYPEILCGDGMDAICTARLMKGREAIVLTVDQWKTSIPVVHVERDN
jgi:hypothetical protein